MSGRRVLVVAGEASGDRHAAGLVTEALRRDPSLSFSGVGGRALREAGVDVRIDNSELGVVGVSEVFGQAGALLGALRTMRRRIVAERPDALLLVDFPDFNLHLAGVAARAGVPVVYFVSPQVWAWRTGRVRKIKRRVSRMIVFFPFEERFYRERGVPVTFSGHPLVDDVPPRPPRREARRELGLDPERPVYGLLPGSRRGESARLLDPLLATARKILEAEPNATFLMPLAETLDVGAVERRSLVAGLPVVALSGAFEPIVAACDAAVAASGTVTLELALRGVPSVVVYRTSALTYAIGRLLVKTKYVCLVNLVAGRGVLPELLQGDFTPERAAAEALALGRPGPAREAALAGIAEAAGRLGPPGAYARAAEAFLDTLDGAARAAEKDQR